jgi:NAD-dependent dihydropyrimidine dehydrogenase PreA subunit
MKRTIIRIDSEKCDGCGLCVSACHEGAIELRDGKAVLVREQHCDGLGDCLGDCPRGAIRLEEREAPAFVSPTPAPAPPSVGPGAGTDGCGCEEPPPSFGTGGCPGSRVRVAAPPAANAVTPAGAALPARVNPSDLSHWPVMLHLVPVRAPFFGDREMVVLSTCAPVASADVHWRFLRGRAVVVACPKLDRTEPYVEKLAGIFAQNPIPRVQVVRMSVPCCGGLSHIVREALRLSGRLDLVVEEVIVDLDGAILSTKPLI